MPELPDLEVFRRYVDATSRHQKIKSVAVRHEKILRRVSARKLQRARNSRERLEGTRGGVRATLISSDIESHVATFPMSIFLSRPSFARRIRQES